ncbi:hypothetical protein L211DRAFT_646281 [Terfezia boudieri ATCC MYA-4762]|uniref:Uncharacterized protein n=1 Tax=Terfezia boudieri ATCC MYA-4762 TaxID=1051890 RepID=A0A3N4LUW7_9PEZI|nr:hypothetical protein L211DRAFT_646281 [Terfezia boudieri ATCC MYA-4762]
MPLLDFAVLSHARVFNLKEQDSSSIEALNIKTVLLYFWALALSQFRGKGRREGDRIKKKWSQRYLSTYRPVIPLKLTMITRQRPLSNNASCKKVPPKYKKKNSAVQPCQEQFFPHSYLNHHYLRIHMYSRSPATTPPRLISPIWLNPYNPFPLERKRLPWNTANSSLIQ